MPNPLAAEFQQPRLATTLWCCCGRLFDLDVLVGDDEQRWAPETVLMELEQYAGGDILGDNFNKLMAVVEVLTTDHFENSLADFIRICNILADSPTDGTFDPAEADEIGWSILEVGLLLGRRPELNLEIQGYVEEMLRRGGLTMLNSPFDIVVRDPHFAWSGTDRPTDDPDLFELGQAAEDERSSQIATWLRERFERLLTELRQAPLRHEPDWQKHLLEDLNRLLHNAHSTTAG